MPGTSNVEHLKVPQGGLKGAGAAGGPGDRERPHGTSLSAAAAGGISSVSRSHLILTPPCLPRAQGTFVLPPSKVSQHPCELGRDSGPPRCPTDTGRDVSVAFPKAPARPAPALGRMVGGQTGPDSRVQRRAQPPGKPAWDVSGHILNTVGHQGAL